MIWHIVRFDFEEVDEDTRRDLEASLAGLEDLEEVAWVRVGRDLTDPRVTGYVAAFRTSDDLAAYRNHPDHVPVVDAIRSAGVRAVRLDIRTEDRVADLPC